MSSLATDYSAATGWQASLELGFRCGRSRTVLSHSKRSGPLSVQRALYPEGDVCHIYLLHPPGGVVGGDTLHIQADCQQHANVLVTTPGATKFYRSAGYTATVKQVLDVAAGCSLEWLPQENIFFPGAKVESSLELNLQADAKAAVWEIQCLGRPVNNERYDDGEISSSWRINRDDQALFIERLHFADLQHDHLTLLNGNPVYGTFLVTHCNETLLETARQYSFNNEKGMLAMTLIDDLMVCRYLGDSTETARQYFASIWSCLREPVFKRVAMVPRIWNT